MMLKGPHAPAIGHAHRHGDSKASLRTPAQTCGMRFYLMQPKIGKARELHFRNRFLAPNCHADGKTKNTAFSQRRVNHPAFAELLDKSLGNPENTAIPADVFTQDHDLVILFHFLKEREIDRFDHCQFSHNRKFLHVRS